MNLLTIVPRNLMILKLWIKTKHKKDTLARNVKRNPRVPNNKPKINNKI